MCISLVEVYRFGHCLGKRFSPISTLFSLVSSRAFRDATQSRFSCRDLKLCLLDFLKMVDLAFSQIYTCVFHLWLSLALGNAWVGDSRPFIFFFSRVFSHVYRCATLVISVSASQTMLTGLFEDARFGPFSNLHTCISLMEVYRFGRCLRWRFSPISTFFSLVSSRSFRDARHSRFRCRHLKLCLLDFLKLLDLALSQI